MTDLGLYVHDGKLSIKGFSTMLIPTKCSGGLVNWHLLYNKDGNRLSYLDNNSPHAEELGPFTWNYLDT